MFPCAMWKYYIPLRVLERLREVTAVKIFVKEESPRGKSLTQVRSIELSSLGTGIGLVISYLRNLHTAVQIGSRSKDWAGCTDEWVLGWVNALD